MLFYYIIHFTKNISFINKTDCTYRVVPPSIISERTFLPSCAPITYSRISAEEGGIKTLHIFTLILLFAAKAADNMLTTGKTILVQRNRPVLASLSVILSQIIFYKLIDSIAASESDLAMYIVSIASGVGTFLALKVNTRFSKERTFVNVILSDDMPAMMELRDFLMEHKITNLTTDGYTKDWQKTIAITAYAETKEQSRYIDEYLQGSNAKFKRLVQKQ